MRQPFADGTRSFTVEQAYLVARVVSSLVVPAAEIRGPHKIVMSRLLSKGLAELRHWRGGDVYGLTPAGWDIAKRHGLEEWGKQ